jgi:hypothetical protein
MKALRSGLFLACCGLLLASSLTFAQSKDESEVGDEPAAGPNCDVTGYKTERIVYPTPVPIPDNAAAGVLLGPIFMPPDGDIVNDVVLEVDWAHTWAGDLIVDLIYDPDCTGPAAGIPSRVLCRARGTQTAARAPCGTSTTNFGCSGDLSANNLYMFSDEALNSFAVGASCATTVPSGCYKQSDQGGGTFSIWRGLPKGGCWYLNVSDNAGADLGSVYGWAVYVRNQRPVPVADRSWGAVKNIYR